MANCGDIVTVAGIFLFFCGFTTIQGGTPVNSAGLKSIVNEFANYTDSINYNGVNVKCKCASSLEFQSGTWVNFTGALDSFLENPADKERLAPLLERTKSIQHNAVHLLDEVKFHSVNVKKALQDIKATTEQLIATINRSKITWKPADFLTALKTSVDDMVNEVRRLDLGVRRDHEYQPGTGNGRR